jgi:uncharacterized protein (DUF362 family)
MSVYLEGVKDYNLDWIREAIENGLDQLEVDTNSARSAVIKPNIVQSRAPETGVVTHPLVAEAITDVLMARGVTEISIAEAPAIGVDVNKAFEISGYADLARRRRLRLVNLFDTPRTQVDVDYGYKDLPNVYKDEELPNYYCGYLSIPSVMLQSDLYINLAKLKTHNRTHVTLTLKNQWGLLDFKDRQMYHRIGLHEPIVQIARAVKPQITVVDGIVGMEGNGPILGQPRHVGVMAVGTDMLETDIVGSQLMGQDPDDIIHLGMAVDAGLGGWEPQVLGSPVEDFAMEFEPAPQKVKKSHNFHLWRNHRACHLDDDAFHQAAKLARRNPRYWMFFAKLAYYTLFKRIDVVRGRGSRLPEFERGQKVIVSGECARELIDGFEEMPKNVIHIPGCPPDPEDIVKAIIRM